MCLGLSPERLKSQEILQAGMLGQPRDDVGHDFPFPCLGGDSRRVNGTGWWFEENGVGGWGSGHGPLGEYALWAQQVYEHSP